MKILVALIALWLFIQPALAALTPEDIREITQIVKAENDELEKRLQKYVDLKFEILDTKFTTKFEAIDKRFQAIDMQFQAIDMQFQTVREGQKLLLILVTGLIALIVLAIGIPQFIIALKQRDQGTLAAELKTLREKVETLEQTRLVKPH